MHRYSYSYSYRYICSYGYRYRYRYRYSGRDRSRFPGEGKQEFRELFFFSENRKLFQKNGQDSVARQACPWCVALG